MYWRHRMMNLNTYYEYNWGLACDVPRGILDVTRLFSATQHGVVNGNDCSVQGKSQRLLFLDHNVSLDIYRSTTRLHKSNLSKYRARARSDSPRANGYSIVSTLNAMSSATQYGFGNETIVPCKASIVEIIILKFVI